MGVRKAKPKGEEIELGSLDSVTNGTVLEGGAQIREREQSTTVLILNSQLRTLMGWVLNTVVNLHIKSDY